MYFTGMTPQEAENELLLNGIENIKFTRLINDKQKNCDKEMVVCVRCNGLTAEIITGFFKEPVDGV